MIGSMVTGPAAKAFAAAAALAVLVMACSLGGAPGAPALSKGVIKAKGSVYVNGVEYGDNAASISIGDTANHADSDLKVGMVVDVEGTISGSGRLLRLRPQSGNGYGHRVRRRGKPRGARRGRQGGGERNRERSRRRAECQPGGKTGARRRLCHQGHRERPRRRFLHGSSPSRRPGTASMQR